MLSLECRFFESWHAREWIFITMNWKIIISYEIIEEYTRSGKERDRKMFVGLRKKKKERKKGETLRKYRSLSACKYYKSRKYYTSEVSCLDQGCDVEVNCFPFAFVAGYNCPLRRIGNLFIRIPVLGFLFSRFRDFRRF